MNSNEINIKENEIFERYCSVAKPLMTELKVRMYDNKIPLHCLNEIRAINDHISRCYRDDVIEKDFEYRKAEGHLRRLTFDCFKHLNILLYDKIARYEKKYFSAYWTKIDGGLFWRNYLVYKQKAMFATIEAKKIETFDPEKSMGLYQEAYLNYHEIEKLLNKKKYFFLKSFLAKWLFYSKGALQWIIQTIILTIISTIILFLL